ncbi:hypothetical protein DPMN_047841 [Dreissena polymorpha]|uniref:Uncharacterized protein n=1 Tax=Dreissena polymorpha TaxID=45954 RepID=A0A9D4D9H6_DREPO|nr:hypothetical protein DPMN_047841 [Dreissena polymorpha]
MAESSVHTLPFKKFELKFFIGVNAQYHYNADRAPVPDPGSTGMNRDSTGMNRGSVWDDRDEPGKTGAPPGKSHREGQATTGAETGNNRDGNVAPPGPIRPRQSYGKPPTVYKKTGALPERHRHSPGLRRGITGDDQGSTGAADGVTLSPGLNRGTTGDNRGYVGASPG